MLSNPERSRAARLVLGEVTDPPWARPALIGVLALTAVLGTWALSINEWANTYYSATVLGMTRSWKAFFFGAVDAGSFITVDKPPLALWVQALSARMFGFNTWSLLVPQALASVLTVWVVHHVVRRAFGHVAGLLAALVLAVTPIAVVMARHNNPDALLVLLGALALWAASNAIRSGRLLPLVWCAVAVGLGFNVKMLQAYFVLPVIAVVYLVAGKPRWTRKLRDLGVATAVLAVVSASWMVAVDATPADARPYVGGSTDNTVRELLLGYNGLGRVFGQEHIASPGMMGGGPGGPGGPGGMSGQMPPGGPGGPGGGGPGGGGPGGGPGSGGPGSDEGSLTRLVSGQVAGQIAWLFPLAAFGTVATPVYLRGRPRKDAQRADFLLWAGTLLVTAAVFSFASGIWHPYYTVALAPPLAAVVGMGVVSMARLYRVSSWWGALFPLSVGCTGVWSGYLLSDTEFLPWLPPVIAALTAVSVGVLGLMLAFTRLRRMRRAKLLVAAGTVGLVAMLSGPTSYALTPLSEPVQSTFPSAGPSGGGPGGPGRAHGPMSDGSSARQAQTPPGQHGPNPPNSPSRDGGSPNTPSPGQKSRRGGPGGGSELPDSAVRYLTAQHHGETWLAATVGAMVAAPVILRTGEPVMAVGGYNGNDPAPTVDELRRYVRDGELRFVWTDGSSGVRSMGGEVDTGVVDESMGWVAAHCTAVAPAEYGATVPGSADETRLYDCAKLH